MLLCEGQFEIYPSFMLNLKERARSTHPKLPIGRFDNGSSPADADSRHVELVFTLKALHIIAQGRAAHPGLCLAEGGDAALQ